MIVMLDRAGHLGAIKKLFQSHPVVAILGPRQVGKTTLARRYAETSDPARTSSILRMRTILPGSAMPS